MKNIIYTIFPFFDYLYILQLEEYDNSRLLRWLPKFYFRRNISKRESLKFTWRVKITFFIGLFFYIAVILISFLIFKFFGLIVFALSLLLIPFFVYIPNFLISIVSEIYYKSVRNRAKKKVEEVNPKVVVIAGSFGKTTVKNYINQLTNASFKTQMIEENINTPNGIADWIIKNLKNDTELLIAEVDTYRKGEIQKSCKILKSDITILTNVADQHEERFKSRKDHKDALLEVFSNVKNSSFIFTNGKIAVKTSDLKLPGGVKHITIGDALSAYKNHKLDGLMPQETNFTNLAFALKAAEVLDIPERFVIDIIKNIKNPERRHVLTKLFDFDCIDDSYNISFTTAVSGINNARKLANAQKKKLLVITAGIPELGRENKDKNEKLGNILKKEADFLIILKSDFCKEIQAGFGRGNVEVVNDITKAFEFLKKQFSPQEWLILLQPELTDLYY